jgi:hypothetical protein
MNYADALIEQGCELKTVLAFIKYHLANPAVWAEFEKFSLEAARRGKKLGAKAIAERIRWESEIVRGEDYKIGNNWIAYYARIFAIKHPSFKDYFEFREVRGVEAVNNI